MTVFVVKLIEYIVYNYYLYICIYSITYNILYLNLIKKQNYKSFEMLLRYVLYN